MAREEALSLMQREIILDRDGRGDKDGSTVVTLTGRNARSARALFDQELTIRYFPFRIGRLSGGVVSLSDEPDLAIEDHSPYHLSRLHLTLEKREERIFLYDPKSSLGSLVDGEPLGENIGGGRKLLLSPGRHEIRMGGDNSPFIFTLDVISDVTIRNVHDHVRYGDRTIPVAVVYHHLCQRTGMIFREFFQDADRGLRMAYELVKSLIGHHEMIDSLYYFSSVPETYGDVIVTHSLNVAIYALRFAQAISVAGEDLVRFTLAALFHDIGMYDVPKEIIDKREPVTDEEFAIIKGHPAGGKEWLEKVEAIDSLLPVVALEHHERVDGNGYPRGRRNLTEYVELIAMVDFFEALTHYRPQRGPITPHEGIRLLIHLREGIFSPSLVRLFLNGFSLFPVYSVVRLSTGEIGQVVAINTDWPLRPVVRIFFDRSGQAVSEVRKTNLMRERFVYINKDISDRIFVDRYFKL